MAVSAVLEPAEQGEFDSKGGRPSKFLPETVARLLNALADGLNIRQACVAAGIGETTLRRWREEHSGLEAQLAEARERARQDALAGIKKAGENGDWRALAEFLKLSFPEHRQPNTKVEVNTNAQAGEVKVLCDEQTRRAIIEARERFLTERPKGLPHPEQPKLQAGTPIGATRVPDPEIALMRSFEGCITDEQIICGADRLGRFGNTD